LYFSRLGRQELAIGPTDMNEVIHDIENTLDVSCSPKIEPSYKVQSLTKRGRNYDWHEEAA